MDVKGIEYWIVLYRKTRLEFLNSLDLKAADNFLDYMIFPMNTTRLHYLEKPKVELFQGEEHRS